MRCLRCGTSFDGAYCPSCGAPAAPPAYGRPCPRCGTIVPGDVCPRCGLPMGAYVYPPPRPPSAGRSVLSILWTIAIVAFLLFALLDYAGLFLAPGFVTSGIQDLRGGSTINAGLDADGSGWTFIGTGTPPATGTNRSVGGNPGGFLETTLFPGTSVGYWSQPFDVAGSEPYAGTVRLDVNVTLGSAAPSGTLHVYVSSAPGIPSPSALVASIPYTSSTSWQEVPEVPVDEALAGPGTYHLTVAFAVTTPPGGTPTVVGLDNVELLWTTDAGVFFYVAVPTLVLLFVSQDPAFFLSYYIFLIAVVALAGAYHAYADRREIAKAFAAPLPAVGMRLRSRSAWITIGQVWVALTFLQVAIVLFIELMGWETSSPIVVTDRNVWVYLYELLNASVYEEVAFRVLLMGVPLAIGSFIVRVLEVNRNGGPGRGRPGAGRHLAGSLRYLVGGNVRGASTKETLLASWAVLFASAVIFGLAHAPGWGWWKVVPSFAAGLAFGYLFLRHGVTAAILAHFVNDYAGSLLYMEYGGDAIAGLISLLFLGLAVAGAGFFAWYLLYMYRHLASLTARFKGRPVAAAMPPRLEPPPAPMRFGPPAPLPGSAPARNARSIPPDYAPTYHPAPYGYPPVRFQCPACGWVEARYEAGRFTCVRCGRVA